METDKETETGRWKRRKKVRTYSSSESDMDIELHVSDHVNKYIWGSAEEYKYKFDEIWN